MIYVFDLIENIVGKGENAGSVFQLLEWRINSKKILQTETRPKQ